MVDGALGNGEDAEEARDRHAGEQIEHDGRAEPVGGEAGDAGGHRIAGMVEGLVAPDALREGAMAEDAQRHRGDRGRKDDAGGLREALRDCDRQEARNSGSDSEASVTRMAATAITVRLARVASTSAPAGVCATMPATVAIDITRPMRASSQCCSVRR